ncbi:MAG: FMN-binding negative transcriptional regulator [Rhodospirillales bacterium]|nr:FMN-binding negative transcriptional regulator [Rhodospirillales bacterium]
MYVPAAFACADVATIHDAIEAYSFGALVTTGSDGIVASHLPFVLDRTRGPNGALLVHLARANPQAQTPDGASAMAIFSGPHGYVSPTWYSAHPSVPTWNYAAIHAYGRLRRIEDAADLEAILRRLTDRYENGRPAPWSIDGLSADYRNSMLRAIVGFEFAVERLDGKFKLSQNRSSGDRRQVIAALAASGSADDRALADFMTRHAAPT